MKAITQKQFIADCEATHKGLYDYTKTNYLRATSKIIVTCRIHGDFVIQANLHRNGAGCQKCSGKHKKTTADFIAEASVIHNNRFDYSKSIYKNSKSLLTIICEHGHQFDQIANNHLRCAGCPVCAGTKKLSWPEFVDRANKLHQDKYTYKHEGYENTSSRLTITCPIHGDFEQTAHCHLAGQGCPKCRGHNKTTEEFVEQAKLTHRLTYDYAKSIYVGSKIKLTITCKEHGDFEQSPNAHLKGAGCPVCSGNKPHTNESFVAAAIEVHGTKYEYSKVKYGKNNTIPVTITCREHGDFGQRPMDHLEGCGCQKCNNYGVLEQELRTFIESLGFVTTKDKDILEGKEIDIYLPEKRVGFEFNGLFWHSEARSNNPKGNHKLKTDLAAIKGVRLIHVYEDDWLTKRKVVENTIKHLLSVTDKQIYARRCHVVEQDSTTFIEENHMLGKSSGVSVSLTLEYKGCIVAAMQFSKSGSRRGNSEEGSYELIRFASLGVVGAASKLFKHFVKTYSPKEVVSYSDNDMFDGKMYEILGFSKVEDVPPDYKVVEGGKRHHKSGYRKERLAARFGDKYDPNKTEHENCLDLKLYRVYNSGLKKWLWTNKGL